MIVYDPDIMGVSLTTTEVDTPMVVDPNAIFSLEWRSI
jgi:hypothetical protein